MRVRIIYQKNNNNLWQKALREFKKKTLNKPTFE
jgi:hypothetical protein